MTKLQPQRVPLECSRFLAAVIALILALELIGVVVMFGLFELGWLDLEALSGDFLAFYTVGQLVQQGEIAQTYYDPWLLSEAYRDTVGKPLLLPWSYPPPFTWLISWTASLPVSLAFGLFVGSTGLLFLVLLYRLGGTWFPAGLIATLPALVVQTRTGQTGFLVAALVAAFCLALLHSQRLRATLSLALLIIKPHLAVGLGLLVLYLKHWRVLIGAFGLAMVLLALSLVLLGPDTWAAFRESARSSGDLLYRGWFPLHRMGSVYASVRSWGGDAAWSLALHIALATVVLAMTVMVWRRQTDLRLRLGSATLISLSLSPYVYDYDLALLAVAVVLLAPHVYQRASAGERWALFALAWISTLWGMLGSLLRGVLIDNPVGPLSISEMETLVRSGSSWAPLQLPTLSGIALFTLVALTLLILMRPVRRPLPAGV